MEKTLVLIKPDGVQRGLIGTIIERLEKRGLRLVAAKFMQVSPELAKKALRGARRQGLLPRIDRLYHFRPGHGNGLDWSGCDSSCAPDCGKDARNRSRPRHNQAGFCSSSSL